MTDADKEAQASRAKKLREKVARLKRGERATDLPMSPKEFTDQAVRRPPKAKRPK